MPPLLGNLGRESEAATWRRKTDAGYSERRRWTPPLAPRSNHSKGEREYVQTSREPDCRGGPEEAYPLRLTVPRCCAPAIQSPEFVALQCVRRGSHTPH